MKLEWGRKVSCPACAMRLYDLTKSVVSCPYCGNIFEPNDYKTKKKSAAVEESVKIPQDFEFEEDLVADDATVLEGDDIDVIKIKEFD